MKFLKFIKVVNKLAKYAKNDILMASSVLHIMSQVEHTKQKLNWQWKLVYEIKRWLPESFKSASLHIPLVLLYSMNFWLEQSTLTPTVGWPSSYAWLFKLIGGVEKQFCWCFTNRFYSKMSSITENGVESHMLYASWQYCLRAMVIIISLVFLMYHPVLGLK